MIFIRLLQNQIPKYWDVIKYGGAKAEGITGERRKTYFVKLLYDLLNGDAQCFLGADDDTKQIHTVFITKILKDKITGDKYLKIENLFSFKFQDMEIRKEQLNLMEQFCKRQKIKEVTFETNNKRVFEIAKMYGAKEAYRVFTYKIED